MLLKEVVKFLLDFLFMKSFRIFLFITKIQDIIKIGTNFESPYVSLAIEGVK